MLIVVLVMLVVITSLVLVMARAARTDAAFSGDQVARMQAQSARDAAITYLRSVVMSASTLPSDNTFDREAVQVGNGYFWYLKHDRNQTTEGYSFGINDEASKINLNTASLATLGRLPNMTTDKAAAIIDWRDTNDTPLESGAESSYYLALSTPYRSKNLPFETLEELLLVRGFNRSALYGADWNRNLLTDPTETDTSLPNTSSVQIDSSRQGLADLLTVYSPTPQSQQSSGNTLVNINNPGANGQLRNLLTQQLDQARANQIMDLVNPNRPFQNVLDFHFKVGLTKDELKKVIGRLTTTANPSTAGLVNVNTAPKDVLAALGSLTEADAQTIISRRSGITGFTDLSDLVDLIDRSRLVSVGGLLTTTTTLISADIVATDINGRAFSRAWIVMDTTSGQLRYFRDITNLGWPLDPQILTRMRQGQTPPLIGDVTTNRLSFGNSR